MQRLFGNRRPRTEAKLPVQAINGGCLKCELSACVDSGCDKSKQLQKDRIRAFILCEIILKATFTLTGFRWAAVFSFQ